MNTPSELFDFYEAYLNIYEAPFEITGPHSYKTGDGRPRDDSRVKNTPTVVSTFKGDDKATRKKARNRADKLNQEYGANVYRVNRADEPRKRGTTVEDSVEYVLDYLIDEGFTDSYKGAEAILETMSDEWLKEIIEGVIDLH
jgi:hypothetical protein